MGPFCTWNFLWYLFVFSQAASKVRYFIVLVKYNSRLTYTGDKTYHIFRKQHRKAAHWAPFLTQKLLFHFVQLHGADPLHLLFWKLSSCPVCQDQAEPSPPALHCRVNSSGVRHLVGILPSYSGDQGSLSCTFPGFSGIFCTGCLSLL